MHEEYFVSVYTLRQVKDGLSNKLRINCVKCLLLLHEKFPTDLQPASKAKR